MTRWAKNKNEARTIAEKYREVGYTVDVWMYNKEGCRKADI